MTRRAARQMPVLPAAPVQVSAHYRLQVATCRSKQTYLSRTVAVNAAFLIGLARHRQLKPYRCPVCADWHLTSKRSS